MKIQFKFEETDYKEIFVIFNSEGTDNDEVSVTTDRDNFMMVIAKPVIQAMSTTYPENSYNVEIIGDDSIKISCPSGDGEKVLNQLYRTFYTLIEFLKNDILSNKYSDEEKNNLAKEIGKRVAELSDDEIKAELDLTKEENGSE